MNESTIRQYRAQLYDQNGTVTITGTKLTDVQAKIAKFCVNPRLEANPNDSNVQFIFSDSHLKGTQPCGWLAEMEVPELLSVKHLTDQRFAAQRAA